MLFVRQHAGCFILGTFLLCAAAGYAVPAEIKAVLLLCSAVLCFFFAGTAVFIYLMHKEQPLFFICMAFLFFCICTAFGSSYLYFDVKYAEADALPAKSSESEIEGVVLKKTYTGIYSSGYNIMIRRIDGRAVNIKAKLQTEYASDLDENEEFIMKATFESIRGDKPDLLRYHLASGFLIHAVSADPDYINTGSSGFNPTRMLSRMNALASEKIKLWVGDEEGDFVSSLTLGNREDTPLELKRDIGRLGLTHILAVSGMHLTVTLGLISFILSKLNLHRYVIYAVLIAFSLFYTGITGLSPSVMRCAFMTVLYYSVLLARERPEPAGSLLLSAAIICLINPPAVLDIGFWLSFSATLGLITAGSMLGSRISDTLRGDELHFRILRFLLAGLSSSFSAVLFPLPFVWIFFGEVSVISPVMTLIFTPFASVILFLTPLFLVFGMIAPAGAFLAAVLKLVSSLFISMASFFARGADYTVSLNYGFVKYIAVLCAALFLLLILIKAGRMRILFIPFLTGIAAFIVCLSVYNGARDDCSYVYYYRYGLGDGFAIMDRNSLLVCDISDGSYGITGKGCDIGRENHIGEIDVYMLTHYHNRMIHTFGKLTDETFIKILCLPEPVNSKEEDIFSALSALASERNCAVALYPRTEGAAVAFGRMTINLFPYTEIKRSPHPVICLGISGGDKSVMYLGGAVYESENAACADLYASSADIIIIGGHSPKLKTVFYPDTTRAELVYYSDRADLSLACITVSAVPVADDYAEIIFGH